MHTIKIKTERLLPRPMTVRDAGDVFEWVQAMRSLTPLPAESWRNAVCISQGTENFGNLTEAAKCAQRFMKCVCSGKNYQ